MLTLAHSWLLLLLPLPLLVWWLAPPRRESRRGLVVPFLDRLAENSGQRPRTGAVVLRAGWLRWGLMYFFWACVVLALARPQLIEPPITREIPVRDLLLAVDLSGSMETQDFKNATGQTVDRLTAVKEVLDDFLAKREGDRVGLIFFGSAAFVQAPFTQDLDVCRELLDEAQVRMAGPQTVFGDALGLAINQFDRSDVSERVLIALTDGNDTSSQVPPEKAAQIARDKGIVIHTVAVGDPTAVGEDALDEATLKQVASTTGGLYSHATDREQLEAIYTQLDELETAQAETISHRPRRDVYWWPLSVALVVSLLYSVLGLIRHRSRSAVPAAAAQPVMALFTPVFLLSINEMPFHFIRPWILTAFVPAALIWWWLRRGANASRGWQQVVAPHLLRHLMGGTEHRSHFTPLAWIAVSWSALILVVAGPTWKREPAPFAEDTAALAIVLRVSPSMKTEDVQPSRLIRSTQKIHDLLELRPGARTSLIAYDGTAHVVMPATRDAEIINTFAEALDPKIMPADGDVAAEALSLADQTLARVGGGSILWITDAVAAEQTDPIANWRTTSRTDLRMLVPLLPGPELDSLTPAIRAAEADVIRLSADDSDVRSVASAAKFARVNGSDEDTQWTECGYWFTPILGLLLLPFFRRGYMVSSIHS